VALLFTSLTGLGAIIMVGSIVLPIMLTLGIPRKTAATLFLLAFALGFIFNLTQWTFYLKTFGVAREQMQPFAYRAGCDRRAGDGRLRERALSNDPRLRHLGARRRGAASRANGRRWYALVTPIVPIVLYFWLQLDAIVAFALAAAYGALSAAPRKAIPTLVAAAIRGVEDVAPAVLLFMGIGMLLVATGLPPVKAALTPLVSAVAPRSWFGYVLLFGLLSPLALYRGPLNPFGVGIAVYTVLAGLGVLPAVTLVAAVMAVVQVQNVCDPTNTQNVWVANFTGVGVDEITKLTLPYQVAVATAATLAVALFGAALLGTQPFRAGAPAAAAEIGTAPPGLFAPPAASETIAVVAAPDPESSAAAGEVKAEIARGWRLSDVGLRRRRSCQRLRCQAVHGARAGDGHVALRDVGLDSARLRRLAGRRVVRAARLRRARERARGALPHANVDARTSRARAQPVRARARLRSRRSQADLLLQSLQDRRRPDARLRAAGRSGLRRGPAHERHRRKARRQVLVGVRHLPNAARAYDGKPHAFLVKRGEGRARGRARRAAFVVPPRLLPSPP
jgi:hypothetical protein